MAWAPDPAPPSVIATDPAKVVYPVPREIVLTPPFVPKVTEAAVNPPPLKAIIGALVYRVPPAEVVNRAIPNDAVTLAPAPPPVEVTVTLGILV